MVSIMTKAEIRKTFSTRNRLKKEIERIHNRIWSGKCGKDADLYRKRLAEKRAELEDLHPKFQIALALTLCPNAQNPK